MLRFGASIFTALFVNGRVANGGTCEVKDIVKSRSACGEADHHDAIIGTSLDSLTSEGRVMAQCSARSHLVFM